MADSKKQEEKELKDSRFRCADTPKEIEDNSVEWPLIKKIFAKGISEAQKKDEENKDENKTRAKEAIALWKHAVSTAGLCYEYYNEYMKPDKNMEQVNATDLYIAAVYFNYYKLLTDGAEHKDLSESDTRKLIEKQISSNKEIKQSNSKSATLKYLFVEDKTYQYPHEVIFVANTLDNLLCLRDDKEELLPLYSVFTILAECESFNPTVVKNFEKMFISQIRESSDMFKITFRSVEEKQAFTGLNPQIKNSILAAISEAMGSSNAALAVSSLSDDNAEPEKRDRKLIVFESDPTKPQQFYDKRTKTLYSLS